MLSSSPLIAFVATENPASAKAFYNETLGLKLMSEDRFALVFDANGTMLRVVGVKQRSQTPYTVLGWEVSDIAARAREMAAAGINFERFPGLEQDEFGIWTAPGGDRVAWFKDPDGNILSISQHKPLH